MLLDKINNPKFRAEKGSVLMAVIIAMVVMGTLGTGMLYLTTTSTYQELMVNRNGQSYYLAESGGRFALSEIRDIYARAASPTSAFNAITALLDNQTFQFGGGSFQIQNVVRTTTSPDTVTFNVVGTVGSGFLQARRQLAYTIQPTAQSHPDSSAGSDDTVVGGPGFDPDDWEIAKEKDGVYAGGPGGSWGDFRIVDDETADEHGAMQVLTTRSAAQARFLLGFDEDFWTSLGGGPLSYDAQVKVKTWNTLTSQWLANFMAGISVRLHGDGANVESFGISFKRGNGPPFALPNATTPYIVLWRDHDGQKRDLIAYRELTSADGVISTAQAKQLVFRDDMEVEEDDSSSFKNWDKNGWIAQSDAQGTYADSGTIQAGGEHFLTLKLTDDTEYGVALPAASVLRITHKGDFNNNHRNGYIQLRVKSNDTWGAWQDVATYTSGISVWTTNQINLPEKIVYPANIQLQLLLENNHNNQSYNNTWQVSQVEIETVDPLPNLVDWSTIMVRVIEDASPRRNRIMAFFGDPNGTSGNDLLIDEQRLSNPRGELHWPPNSPVNYLNPSDDRFTLASGDASLPRRWYWANQTLATEPYTAADGCTYELTSGGTLEPLVAITTTCLTTDTYPLGSEIGLHAFGTEAAGSVYFTDFGFRIPGKGDSYEDGSGEVVQYP